MEDNQLKIEEVKIESIMMVKDYHFKTSRGITIVTLSKEECLTSLTWVLVVCQSNNLFSMKIKSTLFSILEYLYNLIFHPKQDKFKRKKTCSKI